jgi:hypothetical protein
MQSPTLKVSTVATGLTHQSVAAKANRYLQRKHCLREHTIALFVTRRGELNVMLAAALLLGRPAAELFPGRIKE